MKLSCLAMSCRSTMYLVGTFLLWSFSQSVEARPMRPAPYALGDVPPAVLVDGTTRATVVVPRKAAPRVQKAAQLLVDTVKEITGAELAVVDEGIAASGPTIQVGPTKQALKTVGGQLGNLDADGYILFSRPNELIVVGGSEHGTFFGVATLLQKHGGVRWLFPGALGRVIPKQSRLVLENVNLIDEPVMTSRILYLAPTDGLAASDEEWLYCNRMRYRDNFGHHLNMILDSSKYGKTHPEFYPLWSGKRCIPKPDSY